MTDTPIPADAYPIGTYIAGDCTSLGSRKVGRVVAIHPGSAITVYAIVDADDTRHLIERARPTDPFTAAGDAVAEAVFRGRVPEYAGALAGEAARDAGAPQHVAAKISLAAYRAARDVDPDRGPDTPHAAGLAAAFTEAARGTDPHTVGITARLAALAAGAPALEAAATGAEARTRAQEGRPLVDAA
jgi:hypothetical protein